MTAPQDRPIRLDVSKDASEIAAAVATWDRYPSLAEPTTDEALAAYLGGVIAQLPEEQQEVVLLLMSGAIAIGGSQRGWRNAARDLGVDHKTVKRRLEAALASIEEELLAAPSWVRKLLLSKVRLDDEPGPAPALPGFAALLARLRDAEAA